MFFPHIWRKRDNPFSISLQSLYRSIVNVLAFFFNFNSNIDEEKLQYYQTEAKEWKLRYQAAREQNEAQISALGRYATWHASRFSEMDIRVAAMASDITSLISERITLINERTALRRSVLQLQQNYNERVEEIRDLVQENGLLDQQVDALSAALQTIHALAEEVSKAREDKKQPCCCARIFKIRFQRIARRKHRS